MAIEFWDRHAGGFFHDDKCSPDTATGTFVRVFGQGGPWIWRSRLDHPPAFSSAGRAPFQTEVSIDHKAVAIS